MSKVKEYSAMTKDKLMTYTFVALVIIAAITSVMWFGVTAKDMMTQAPIGMDYGVTLVISCLIAVGVAVGVDILLHKVAADSPLNIMSAAVFGMIVALCYSYGEPTMRGVDVLPLLAPQSFMYVALITLVGMVLFKKLQGLKGRKYVNPAAAAKLLVLAFVGIFTVLIPSDHLRTGMLGVPSLSGPIGYDVINGNGAAGFAFYIQGCFGNPNLMISSVTQSDIINTLLLQKFHGWAGGASSIAVIIVGIALFAICRRYIKWRITVGYLATVALAAVAFAFAFGDPDPLLRVLFHLFVGSSIFLAFFMATDPATTPITYLGQIIFGVGLAILTVLIQTYMGFFGGSILALVVMNLISPFLDKVGTLKPIAEKKEPKLPKAKQFTIVKTTDCIRCGACMRVCCHKLSPILIKEAFDKKDVNKLVKLQADLCEGCGHCNFVCPARIDLRSNILKAKAMLRQK